MVVVIVAGSHFHAAKQERRGGLRVLFCGRVRDRAADRLFFSYDLVALRRACSISASALSR